MSKLWVLLKSPIILFILLILLTISIYVLNHYDITHIDNQLLIQLTPLIGLISGLFLVVWQIGKQHTNSIRLQEDALKQKIKLDVFSELDKTLSQCQESLINISNTILLLPMNLSTQIYMVSEFSDKIPNFQPPPMRERVLDIISDHSHAMKNLISVIIVLEKYEITFPDNSIKPVIIKFQKRIEEIGKCFTELNGLIGKYLPIDVPPEKVKELGEIYVPPLPTNEQLEVLDKLSKQYNKYASNLLGYIYDIRIESQNLLLGSLFNRTLPSRQPTDKTIDVIKFTDND